MYSEYAVINCDRIVHKNVRTLDKQGMDKVIAVPNNEDTIFVHRKGKIQQYKIPKSSLGRCDEAKVLLRETDDKISSSFYQVDSAYSYEANLVRLSPECITK